MVLVLALLPFTVGLGCGGTSKVEGVVTLDGKAVDGASVVFMPEDGKGQSAVGGTDANGNFSLTTNNKPGAAKGSYKVVISKVKVTGEPMTPADSIAKMKGSMPKSSAGPAPIAGGPAKSDSLLPAKYASPSTTPFTIKIPLESSPLKLEMTSK